MNNMSSSDIVLLIVFLIKFILHVTGSISQIHRTQTRNNILKDLRIF